jgi:hypothetical protein
VAQANRALNEQGGGSCSTAPPPFPRGPQAPGTAAPEADPYELAREAIIALNLLRAGVAHNENLTMKIELVAERVRWLAIGPGD